jgi:histone-lysine N-methyltransferase SETMAR
MLQTQQHSWHHFVMLDESLFYLNTDDERIWFAPREASSDREHHTIHSPNFMLTLNRGFTGFYVVKLLPKGDTFNPSSSVDEIISEIASSRETQRGSTNRRLVVHLDNDPPHIVGNTLRYVESCAMIRVPHPPYSPDLAPSDFFRFSYLKSMLRG